MNNRLIIVLTLFLSITRSLGLLCQTVPEDLQLALNTTLEKMRAELDVKSLSGAIVFSDGACWQKAQGISSQNPKKDVTENDVYLIGSVTKTITAACILQIVEENSLNLDDPIGNYLDSIRYVNPNITIRQLLQHQSGIYDVLENNALNSAMINNQNKIFLAENILKTYLKPPVFQPGTSWAYSNSNYLLLSVIIKKISGKTFYEEYRNRFYTPLNLSSFSIPSFEPITNNIAHVWLDITGDGKTDDAHNFYLNYTALNSTAGAAGGYYATAKETSIWMRKFMRGDLVAPDLMAQAFETVTSPGLPGTTYGLGTMKKTFSGEIAYGHGGDLAYAASSWYFPSFDLSITVLCNDAKNNSWTLAPVISALLDTYTQWKNTTATNEQKLSFATQMEAYPNPFESDLKCTIEVNNDVTSDYSAVLYNNEGNKIAENTKFKLAQNALEFTFDQLSSLPQGSYFVTIYNENKRLKTISLVKQHP